MAEMTRRAGSSGRQPPAARPDRRASGTDAEVPTIGVLDTTELVQAIRGVFGDVDKDGLAREDAIRATAENLGAKKLGPKAREAIDNALRAASRRGIVVCKAGRVYRDCVSIDDYPTDLLKQAVLADMGRVWWTRDEVITTSAYYLGFRRCGNRIRDAFKRAINGLIRQGELEYEGDRVRRCP